MSGIPSQIPMKAKELPVKIGSCTLNKPMTRAQALRYGEHHMPLALKRAGFKTVVFKSNSEIHGGSWYRISYAK